MGIFDILKPNEKLKKYEAQLKVEAEKKREKTIFQRKKKRLEEKYERKSKPVEFSDFASALKKGGAKTSEGVKKFGASPEWAYLQRTAARNEERLAKSSSYAKPEPTQLMNNWNFPSNPTNLSKGTNFGKVATHDFWGSYSSKKKR